MYIDLLNRIRNAQAVHKERIKVPYSKMDMKVAEVLVENKFIDAAEKKGRMPKRIIDIRLRYDENKLGAITGVRLMSKPSRKMYSGYQTIRPVRQGHGIAVISTSKGIKTGKLAKKEKMGGEMLFQIW